MTSHKLTFERVRVEGRLRKLEVELSEGSSRAVWREYHHAQETYHRLRLKEYSGKYKNSLQSND